MNLHFFFLAEYKIWAVQDSSGFRFYRGGHWYDLREFLGDIHLSQHWHILRRPCRINTSRSILYPTHGSLWIGKIESPSFFHSQNLRDPGLSILLSLIRWIGYCRWKIFISQGRARDQLLWQWSVIKFLCMEVETVWAVQRARRLFQCHWNWASWFDLKPTFWGNWSSPSSTRRLTVLSTMIRKR